MTQAPPVWRRYAALGDSFTEGLDDPSPDGSYRGWADLTAAALAARDPGFRYANLAVRGRLLPQVVAEQVPAAIALEPDLVSIAAGVNDVLRRHWEPGPAGELIASAISDLRAAGADVLVVAFGDATRRSRVMGRVAERVALYNEAVKAAAAEHGAYVMDFWGAAVFDDDVFWSPDRLHLSSAGHERAAGAALHALGLADESWRTPIASTPPVGVARSAASTARWAGGHFAPWLWRRARGISSGDGVEPKRPGWTTIDPA